MKIGIIGNGTHSKKIQNILKKNKLKFFIYKPQTPNYYDKKKFNELKKCNVIFILSPNKSHFYYISKLYKNRYIFCEKPPVNNKKELIKLKKINLKKIYFNFNLRFLKICKFLKERKKYKLGKLIYANLSFSHGLAQKQIYKNNWRSNIKNCPKGVYEIVSIHYIDMINFFFKVSNIEKPSLINSSKIGTSFDTSLVKIKLQDRGMVNIFSTYNSSYNKNFMFLFKNGIIEQKNNLISVRGPTMSLNKYGHFKLPKLLKKIKISEKKDFSDSLADSVNYFLKSVKKNKTFDKKEIDASIKSNHLLF